MFASTSGCRDGRRRSLSPLFAVIDLDSAALAGSATIVHPMRQAGTWHLSAHRHEGRAVRAVTIRVQPDASSMAVAIDLGAGGDAAGEGARGQTDGHTLRVGGYLRLNSTAAEGGFFALLHNVDTGEVDWDSRRLERRDVFACLPLRPGEYRLTNTIGTAERRLVVPYPDPRNNSGTRPDSLEPVRIRSRDIARTGELTVRAGQGFVVDIDAAARLSLALRMPDDGPADLPAWREAQAKLSRLGPRSGAPR
jgi:hypothetical protein